MDNKLLSFLIIGLFLFLPLEFYAAHTNESSRIVRERTEDSIQYTKERIYKSWQELIKEFKKWEKGQRAEGIQLSFSEKIYKLKELARELNLGKPLSLKGEKRLIKVKGCPICESEYAQVLYKSIPENPNFSIVRDPKSGLIFVNPMPTEEEIEKIYTKKYFEKSPHEVGVGYESYSSRIETDEEYFGKRVELVEEFIGDREDVRLLDIGCAYGYFLNMAKQKGWDVSGVDISEFAVTKAKELFGLDVFQGTLQEAQFNDSEFDVVTFWGMLEHLRNPLKELKEARRILKDDGILVAGVPNAESLQAELLGNNFYFGDHLYNFTPRTISMIIKKAGFEIVNLSTIEGILREVLNTEEIERLLRRNKGYHIFVVAKKE